MKRPEILLGTGILFLIGGILLFCLGFVQGGKLCFFGFGGIAAGIWSVLAYISSGCVWICKECYLRFETPVHSLLSLPGILRPTRRFYCPKCKKKTRCKGKRVVIRSHIF